MTDMNNRLHLPLWFVFLVAGLTVIVIIASLFVLRLPDPWNWGIPLVFIALTTVVGFLADILGIRSAMLGEQTATKTSIVTGPVAVGEQVIQAGGDVVLQVYRTPARVRRVHAPPGTRHQIFGRDPELERITTALQEHRTVLLHGMGGIGKTALAAEAAQRLHATATFADGVLWLSEIGTASIATICDAIARHLGDKEIPKMTPQDKLDSTRELLATHNLLLILDDIASPDAAQTFLNCCRPTGIGLLATSRQRHLVFDEDVPLRPLDHDAAIALFRDRANMPAANGKVGEICDVVENHPLALVIAAGRVRGEAMPLARLHERLTDEKTRLSSLRLGDAQDKNRSVWASLNVSYADLSDGQRRVFTFLAACFGETAGLELLAGISGTSQAECEDHIGRLVARSLAEREDDRATLHRLVRDFGRDVLGTDLQTAHVQILAAVRAYASRHAQATPEEYDELQGELGNLLGAVTYAAECQDWATVLALADVIGMPADGILGVRGYWMELIGVGRLAIQAAEASHDEYALAKWTHNTGVTLQAQGDYDQARSLYQHSLKIAAKLGNQAGIASSLHQLGGIAQAQGDYDQAQSLYQQSLEIKEKLGDQAGIALRVWGLAMIAQAQGNMAEAKRQCEEALAVFQKLGDKKNEAGVLHQLGMIAQAQGDYDQAQSLCQHSLEIFEKLGDQAGIALTMSGLAMIAQAQGNMAEAKRQCEEALAVFQKLGDKKYEAGVLHQLGMFAQDYGDYDQARSLYQQSLEIFEKLGNQAGIALSLHKLGMIAQDQGDYDQARSLYQQSLEIFERLGSPDAETAERNLASLDWRMD
jgi:tetratricopeptide (TPR) repeat protein